MNRRLLLTLPLLLAACEADPSGAPVLDLGDPVRRAALNAPRQFGDLSVWQGQPVQAALAVVQIEFLADALPNDPIYRTTAGIVQVQLAQARAEIRQYLGIAAEVPPAEVMAALREVAATLDQGLRARAEAAVARPGFAPGLLGRLAALPRLPTVSAAAGTVYQEIVRGQSVGRT
jgi:hypothetical protein